MRFLAVEDKMDQLEPLLECMRLDGHEADGATTKAEAIRLLAANRYDAVMTDWRLDPGPPGGGGRIVAHLRRSGTRTPCLMVTAYPEEDFRAVSSVLAIMGGVEVMHNPYEPELVMAALCRLAGAAPEGGPSDARG